MTAYAEEPGRDYRKERDAAYTERNRLVAALARLLKNDGWEVWLAEHDPSDAGWDPEWRTIVFIEGPTGQLSWHLHNSDVPLFGGLPRGPNRWDGHSTPEKYERVEMLGRPVLPYPPGMGEESRRLHREYLALVAAQRAGAKNGADVVRLTDECAAKGIILMPGGENL